MDAADHDFWLWLYRHIEEWWGEELDDRLAAKISAAPREQIATFSESLDRFQSTTYELPSIPRGKIRPLVALPDIGPYRTTPFTLSLALRVLLYSHEIVLENDFIRILYYLNKTALISPSTRGELRRSLHQLAVLRPFVMAESVHFAHVLSPGRHPSNYGRCMKALDDPDVFELACQLEHIDPSSEVDRAQLASAIMLHFGVLNFACAFAEMKIATPLARSDLELKMLTAVLERPTVDGRQSVVSSLARLQVPDFANDPAMLVKLRNDDEAFGMFRERLSGALSHIDGMHDSVDMGEAADIVY